MNGWRSLLECASWDTLDSQIPKGSVGQAPKHSATVTTGYVLGLQMPESGRPQPSPDSTDATGQRALLSFCFPCHPFFVVMDS